MRANTCKNKKQPLRVEQKQRAVKGEKLDLLAENARQHRTRKELGERTTESSRRKEKVDSRGSQGSHESSNRRGQSKAGVLPSTSRLCCTATLTERRRTRPTCRPMDDIDPAGRLGSGSSNTKQQLVTPVTSRSLNPFSLLDISISHICHHGIPQSVGQRSLDQEELPIHRRRSRALVQLPDLCSMGRLLGPGSPHKRLPARLEQGECSQGSNHWRCVDPEACHPRPTS